MKLRERFNKYLSTEVGSELNELSEVETIGAVITGQVIALLIFAFILF